MLSFDEGSLFSWGWKHLSFLNFAKIPPRRDCDLVGDGGPLAYSFLNEAPFFGNFSLYRNPSPSFPDYLAWPIVMANYKDSLICFLDLRLYPKSL